MARAVRDELEAGLFAGGAGRSISRAHVLLFRRPASACAPLHQSLWDVAALAALGAMDFGRRVLARLAIHAVLDAPAMVAIAARRAKMQFWRLLFEFAAFNRASRGWAGVSPSHPLLGVTLVPGSTPAVWSVRVILPPGRVLRLGAGARGGASPPPSAVVSAADDSAADDSAPSSPSSVSSESV